MRQYLHNVLVAIDDLGNAIANGHVGETISAHAGTARNSGRLWGCWLCALLDWLRPDHCHKAILADRARAEAVEQDLK